MDDSNFSESDMAKWDQTTTNIARTVPSLCWSLYQGFLKEGFTEHQALELIKTYIASTI